MRSDSLSVYNGDNSIMVQLSAYLYLLLTVLCFMPSISGCSVAMALHGKQEPNFAAFEEGSSRKQVEIELGTFHRNLVSSSAYSLILFLLRD